MKPVFFSYYGAGKGEIAMKKRLAATALACAALVLCACSQRIGTNAADSAQPLKLPAKVQLREDGEPMLNVYLTDEEKTETQPLEEYLCGVLAGEMRSDWPMEALKAQAILARTFVLKFMEEKESRYPGADISTDIEEAQAYDAAAVNDRIRQAVRDTRGQVLVSDGALIYAWFHAHSGGVTAGAKEGLNWKAAEPRYIRTAEGRESASAPAEAQAWQAAFSAEEIIRAANAAGAAVKTVEGARIGERGASGRAVTLVFGGVPVNAADFRIALGSTKMRSTLLTNLAEENGYIEMEGKGYGHGVGMSQWGAYGQAEAGATAEEIVLSYFQNVEVVKAY